MQVFVDGIIYSLQPRGGISRVFTEVLPRVCEQAPDIDITMLTHGRLQQQIPAHPRIREVALFPMDVLLRPHFLWQPFAEGLRQRLIRYSVGAPVNAIWHSTYLTEPISWRGPIVTTVYDMIHERFPDLFDSPEDIRFRRAKRQAIAMSHVIVCISEATARDVRQYYGESLGRIEVVPLACSDRFVPSSDYPPRTPATLLYVGARYHYKQFWNFLGALQNWERRGDCEVVAVGSKWSREEQLRLAAMPNLPCVRNLGPLPDEDLCKLYNEAAAFVYPSLYEGFGIPLLEAMACRCPVVASDIPSTREVAADAAYYFTPGDVESLRTALSMALDAGRQSTRVGVGVRRAATFNWNATAQRYAAIYRSIAT